MKNTKPPVIKIISPKYQPSRAELREDLRVDATPEEATRALMRTREVQYIEKPSRVSR